MNDSTKAVFLSYASQDAGAASRICQTLREAGIEVWLDQSELRGGDAWDAAIRKQIKAHGLSAAGQVVAAPARGATTTTWRSHATIE